MKLTSLLVAGMGLALVGAAALWAAQPPASPALTAPAGAAASARQVVTRAELQEAAKSGRVWCQDWRSSDETCGAVAFMDVMADGSIQETVWFQLSQSPNVQIGLRDAVQFEGDALCSVNDSRRTSTSVLVDGRPASSNMSFIYSLVVQRQLQEDDGKRSCETFYRDASGQGMLSNVITDGQRDPSLDAAYRLLDKGAKVALRTGGADRLAA